MLNNNFNASVVKEIFHIGAVLNGLIYKIYKNKCRKYEHDLQLQTNSTYKQYIYFI